MHLYLCIGVLLTLLIKFSKKTYYNIEENKERAMSNEFIGKCLFEVCLESDEMYTTQKISPIINCAPESKLKKKSIVDYYRDYNINDPRDIDLLHSDFGYVSNTLLNEVINPNHIDAFIESLLIIIENDDSIASDDIIGMDSKYTKYNIMQWIQYGISIDVCEFLANILYFTYLRPNNERGAFTLTQLDSAFMQERRHSLNKVSLENKQGEKVLTFNFAGVILPKQLTKTTVINTTSQDVLFREKECEDILKIIASQVGGNIFLYGDGGHGKTSLARMIYCQLKDRYDCHGWVNYTGNIKESIIRDFSIEFDGKTMTEVDITKKWEDIKNKLQRSKQSKLLVIDNVDNIYGIDQIPVKDTDLIDMSSWSNLTIIITSRLNRVPGYRTTYHIDKLSLENCVELFYHYNPSAEIKRAENYEIIKKLCALADNNTMVIELLSKGSIYKDLESFYTELKESKFSCAQDALIETDHDYTVIKVDSSCDDYYDIGNETVATQLFKLFNLKTRSLIHQLVLWDFHCLPENERVSIDELKNWFGIKEKDVSQLVNEGWIKLEENFYSIHPLVSQAIACSPESSNSFWKLKKELMDVGTCSSEMLDLLANKNFFNETDNFELSLRKLIFVDALTYHGEYLVPETWLSIADFARKCGNVSLGIFYYKKTHEYYDALKDSVELNVAENYLFWKSTYYYGYMLSYTRTGYEEAERLLTYAVELSNDNCDMRDYSRCTTHDDLKNYAKSLDHLGYILSNSLNNDISRIAQADYYLNLAIEIRHLLCGVEIYQDSYLHDYAWSLDNIGAFYANIDLNNIDTNVVISITNTHIRTPLEIAEQKAISEYLLKEALLIRKAFAIQNNDCDSTEVAWTYFNLASLLMSIENDPDLYNFDSSYIKDKYEQLRDFKHLQHLPNVINIDDILEKIYEMPCIRADNKRLGYAEEYIKDALDIYHRLDGRFPGQHMSSEARTTALYGRLLKFDTNRQEESQQMIARAIKLYTLLNNENHGIYEKEVDMLKSCI